MPNQEIIDSIKNEICNVYLTLEMVSADTYESLKSESLKSALHLYDLIRDSGLVNNEVFLKKLSEKYGVQYDIEALSIEPLNKSFPIKFCEKNGLALLKEDSKTIEVGVVVPSSLSSLKNLSLFTGKKVSAKFVLPKVIFASLGLVESDLETAHQDEVVEVSDEDSSESNAKVIPKRILRAAPSSSRVPASDTKETSKSFDSTSVIKAVDDIFSKAIDGGASDIHVEVFKDFSSIRYRKNGTLIPIQEYKKFLTDNYVAVVARIKILANLDIAEKRLPQDGKIAFKSASGKEVDFRVSVLPTNLGERIVIRILSSTSLAVSVDALGFNKKQSEAFIEAIESPQGLILVTGPTGSGKSTTLYGAINYLNKPDVNILTAEDPVEYTLSGISQVQVRENIGLTFANALRSFLRQDPEIILVGEIRDAETADIATKAALTGHLVLSTLHTNSSIGAITRLINMGLAPYLVSSALTLVVAQRLIRLNCPSCSADEVVPKSAISSDLAEQLGTTKAMRASGCEKCSYTGYAGRRAVHEVLQISPKIQKAINEGASENFIYHLALEDGFEPMAKSALRFIINGELSIEEYLRVIPKSDEVDS